MRQGPAYRVLRMGRLNHNNNNNVCFKGSFIAPPDVDEQPFQSHLHLLYHLSGTQYRRKQKKRIIISIIIITTNRDKNEIDKCTRDKSKKTRFTLKAIKCQSVCVFEYV